MAIPIYERSIDPNNLTSQYDNVKQPKGPHNPMALLHWSLFWYFSLKKIVNYSTSAETFSSFPPLPSLIIKASFLYKYHKIITVSENNFYLLTQQRVFFNGISPHICESHVSSLCISLNLETSSHIMWILYFLYYWYIFGNMNCLLDLLMLNIFVLLWYFKLYNTVSMIYSFLITCLWICQL